MRLRVGKPWIAGILGLALIGSLVVSAPGHALSRSHSAMSKEIGVSSLGADFRVTLTAIRGSGGGGAPPATVRIGAFENSGGNWRSIGDLTVGASDSWFWYVATGGHATCLFSASDVPPNPIQVRLLESPSIGCSAVTYDFHVQDGELVPG